MENKWKVENASWGDYKLTSPEGVESVLHHNQTHMTKQIRHLILSLEVKPPTCTKHLPHSRICGECADEELMDNNIVWLRV